MLTTGFFSDKLKIKKGDNTSFFDNTPISILPSLSKILEKMFSHNCMPILKVINYSIAVNMALNKDIQLNFPLLELIDKITFPIQEGKVPVGVFLDMSKASDTLN